MAIVRYRRQEQLIRNENTNDDDKREESIEQSGSVEQLGRTRT